MAEIERNASLLTGIKKPVIAVDRFRARGHVGQVWLDSQQKCVELAGHVLMEINCSSLIHEADIHGLFVKIDATTIAAGNLS